MTKLDEKKLKKDAEKYLTALLDKACLSLDIQLKEWDINEELFKAVISSPKIKHRTCQEQFETYSTCHTLIKKLNIKVCSKFKWFTDIKKHTTSNK
jgi:hypothetical protein